MPDINLLELDSQNVLHFDMGGFEELSGVLILSQWIVKLLLEDPEHPMSSPGAVGLNKMIYSTNDRNLDVKITDKINHVEDYITTRQSEKSFDDPEELDRINIRDIRIEDTENPTDIFIEMDVINKNENKSRVSLPIGG